MGSLLLHPDHFYLFSRIMSIISRRVKCLKHPAISSVDLSIVARPYLSWRHLFRAILIKSARRRAFHLEHFSGNISLNGVYEINKWSFGRWTYRVIFSTLIVGMKGRTYTVCSKSLQNSLTSNRWDNKRKVQLKIYINSTMYRIAIFE